MPTPTEVQPIFTDRMTQEMNLLCQMPPFRMLQRHVVAANAEDDSARRAMQIATAISEAFRDRLLAVIR